MRLLVLPALLLIAACAGQPKTVIKEVPVEVRVPVRMPCMREEPEPVVPLRDNLTREEWDALTTDQRMNLVASQAIHWMLYGLESDVASAGCR